MRTHHAAAIHDTLQDTLQSTESADQDRAARACLHVVLPGRAAAMSLRVTACAYGERRPPRSATANERGDSEIPHVPRQPPECRAAEARDDVEHACCDADTAVRAGGDGEGRVEDVDLHRRWGQHCIDGGDDVRG